MPSSTVPEAPQGRTGAHWARVELWGRGGGAKLVRRNSGGDCGGTRALLEPGLATKQRSASERALPLALCKILLELTFCCLAFADTERSASCASPFRSSRTLHTQVPSGDAIVLDATPLGPCEAGIGLCADVRFAVSSDQPVDVFATAGGGEPAGFLEMVGPWTAQRVLCRSVVGRFPVGVQAANLLLTARCHAPSGRACRFASALDIVQLDRTAGSRISGAVPSQNSGNRPGRVTGSQEVDAASIHHGTRSPCIDPTTAFSANSLQRVELEIGATRLFSIDGCGEQGSCSNVRFIATSETAGGDGQLSWFIALSEEERQRAIDGDLRGFAVGRDAWTRSSTTCALEEKGLISPRQVGARVHFILRCDHSSPVPCVADVAVTAVSLGTSLLPVAMRSGMRASLEEAQIQVVTALQDPPTIARLASGEWLAIPVGGCDAQSCTLSIAAMSLVDAGRATVVVQSSQQEGLDEFDLDKTAASRSLPMPSAEDPARVLVRCSGGDDDHCHFAVGVSWEAANARTGLHGEVPVLESRRAAGAKCTIATQCESGGCRGGVCCQASEGSASSDCVECQVGTGACALRATDLVAPTEDACSGPTVDAMCGVARGGRLFRCSQTGSPQLSSRTSGACYCGDSLRLWGTGAGHHPVPVCGERVALQRNASASAAAAFASFQENDEADTTPRNDGGFMIAMGVVVATVALAGVAVVLVRSRGSLPHDDPQPAIPDEEKDEVVLPHSPKPKSFGSIDRTLGHPPILEVEEGEEDDSDGEGVDRCAKGLVGAQGHSTTALASSSYVVQMLDTSKRLSRQVEQSPSPAPARLRTHANSGAASMSASCPIVHGCAIPALHTLRQLRQSSKGSAIKTRP